MPGTPRLIAMLASVEAAASSALCPTESVAETAAWTSAWARAVAPGGALAQRDDLQRERQRAGGAAPVGDVERAAERLRDAAVQRVQRLLALGAEVQLEPGFLWNGVEAGAAADPDHAGGRAGLGGQRQLADRRGGDAHGVRGVGDAERGPRVAAGSAERRPQATRAKGAMDHALGPRAVQGDEGHGLERRVAEEVLRAGQVAGPFLAGGRDEGHRGLRPDPRVDHRSGERHDARQPSGVVADPRRDVARSVLPHRQVGPGGEDGVEMRGDHDAGAFGSRAPGDHVAGRVAPLGVQAHRPEPLGQGVGAEALVAGGRGDRGDAALPGERLAVEPLEPFAGPLDLGARRYDLDLGGHARSLTAAQGRRKRA